MKKLQQMVRWAGCPQLWLGLVVMGLCGVGFALQSAEVQPAVSAAPFNRVVGSPAANQDTQPVDCSVVACLALTFDDGPSAAYTPKILDTLQRHHAKATFFILGSHVSGNEALLQRTHKEGHEIGNHSWGHPHFTQLSPEQIEHEITSTQNVIIAAGVPAPHLFRPPYGDINPTVMSYVPLTIVRWNIDPEDWHPKRQLNMLNHMAVYAKRGGVVVMHDTEIFTADALDQLLTQLEGHYRLVTVSELFNLIPGQRGVYFGR